MVGAELPHEIARHRKAAGAEALLVAQIGARPLADVEQRRGRGQDSSLVPLGGDRAGLRGEGEVGQDILARPAKLDIRHPEARRQRQPGEDAVARLTIARDLEHGVAHARGGGDCRDQRAGIAGGGEALGDARGRACLTDFAEPAGHGVAVVDDAGAQHPAEAARTDRLPHPRLVGDHPHLVALAEQSRGAAGRGRIVAFGEVLRADPGRGLDLHLPDPPAHHQLRLPVLRRRALGHRGRAFEAASGAIGILAVVSAGVLPEQDHVRPPIGREIEPQRRAA